MTLSMKLLEVCLFDINSLSGQIATLSTQLAWTSFTLLTLGSSATSYASNNSLFLVATGDLNSIAICRLIMLTMSTFLAALETFYLALLQCSFSVISPRTFYTFLSIFTVPVHGYVCFFILPFST